MGGNKIATFPDIIFFLFFHARRFSIFQWNSMLFFSCFHPNISCRKLRLVTTGMSLHCWSLHCSVSRCYKSINVLFICQYHGHNKYYILYICRWASNVCFLHNCKRLCISLWRRAVNETIKQGTSQMTIIHILVILLDNCIKITEFGRFPF